MTSFAATFALSALALSVLPPMPAWPLHPSIDTIMMKLEPATRIKPRCMGRAIGIICRQERASDPDEGVAYAFALHHCGAARLAMTAPG